MYGIPQFRLPKEIVQHEIEGLKQMGVHVQTNAIIGRTFTIDELMKEEGFNAVYIATGAGLPHFMHIPGEQFNGVYAANEFLTRVINPRKPDESVHVPTGSHPSLYR